MDSHSSHMELEKEGAERVAMEKAIAAQRAADLDHLLKNTHPSLRDSISLGDISDGSCHNISDYSAQIHGAQIEVLKEAVQDLRNDFEKLRSQVLADWTPETPLEEPEQAPAPTPAPAPVIELPAPTPTPTENGVTVLQAEAPAEVIK